jgi:two-component sensor histidine kinase
MELRPLSEGNWIQRRYLRWAAPHYARMTPELREQAELIDRFLYSRRGLWFWAGLLGATVGSVVGLMRAGLPALLATVISLLAWLVLPLAGLAAWLQPARFQSRDLRKKLPLVMVLALGGALAGFLVGHVAKHGSLDLARFGNELWRSLALLVPAGLAAGLAMLVLVWGIAHARRQGLERELERGRLARERDQAARQAAEAQLRLLQGQIQPHFIFNTLAAVQHWVDTTDPRAGPMLRSLTAFLRGSTEMLGREQATLAEEATVVEHYLQIMQARLGTRLHSQVEIEAELGNRQMPPGLLLTLVENAIEHGVSPVLDGASVRVQAQREADGWSLSVSDDGAGLTADWQEGLGLANCRQRLLHHFGERASLVLTALQPGTEARITVHETGVAE